MKECKRQVASFWHAFCACPLEFRIDDVRSWFPCVELASGANLGVLTAKAVKYSSQAGPRSCLPTRDY
eukprot:6208696-Pleurochrysis_carterae.AAC.6